MRATWKPHEKHGRLTTQSDLPDSVYAFPKQRKEPLTDARHVRNAIARLDQVEDVSEGDRELAFANIKKAADHYGVELSESSWQDVGVHPQGGTSGALRGRRKTAAKKTAATTTARKTSARKKASSKKSSSKKTSSKKSWSTKSSSKKSGRKR